MTVGQRLPEVLEAPNGRKWSVRPGRRNGVLVATSGEYAEYEPEESDEDEEGTPLVSPFGEWLRRFGPHGRQQRWRDRLGGERA